ncbi:MAG: class I SAM-dependent methyltransferase [Acidimicrobiales bacterium]
MELLFPPEEIRALIGTTDLAAFDNPSGDAVIPDVERRTYGDILDFGCGCGRLARQFVQQIPQPRSYLGLDLHAGMASWCADNLAPFAAQFRFEHHDVFSPGFNPEADNKHAALPVQDQSRDLVIAHSVFTHITEDSAIFYLEECARVLRDDGYLVSTWFLFDKRQFPMMQPFQNALYINTIDPTNAVIFDGGWLKEACQLAGLRLVSFAKPELRGYHWVLRFARTEHPSSFTLPDDDAPIGSLPPPILTVPLHTIGVSQTPTPSQQEAPIRWWRRS